MSFIDDYTITISCSSATAYQYLITLDGHVSQTGHSKTYHYSQKEDEYLLLTCYSFFYIFVVLILSFLGSFLYMSKFDRRFEETSSKLKNQNWFKDVLGRDAATYILNHHNLVRKTFANTSTNLFERLNKLGLQWNIGNTIVSMYHNDIMHVCNEKHILIDDIGVDNIYGFVIVMHALMECLQSESESKKINWAKKFPDNEVDRYVIKIHVKINNIQKSIIIPIKYNPKRGFIIASVYHDQKGKVKADMTFRIKKKEQELLDESLLKYKQIETTAKGDIGEILSAYNPLPRLPNK